MREDKAAKAPGDGAESRILVIDDDRKLCRLIREYLEPNGYEVETVHSGPDGLERAQSDQFSAVILDVMLPGMDGFEVCRQLRADEELDDVHIIMLTTMGMEADRQRALDSGVSTFLTKPFDAEEVLSLLETLFDD